jgi:hypothetical protein
MSGRSVAIARRTAPRPSSAKLLRPPVRRTSTRLMVVAAAAPVQPEQTSRTRCPASASLPKISKK